MASRTGGPGHPGPANACSGGGGQTAGAPHGPARPPGTATAALTPLCREGRHRPCSVEAGPCRRRQRAGASSAWSAAEATQPTKPCGSPLSHPAPRGRGAAPRSAPCVHRQREHGRAAGAEHRRVRCDTASSPLVSRGLGCDHPRPPAAAPMVTFWFNWGQQTEGCWGTSTCTRLQRAPREQTSSFRSPWSHSPQGPAPPPPAGSVWGPCPGWGGTGAALPPRALGSRDLPDQCLLHGSQHHYFLHTRSRKKKKKDKSLLSRP